MSSLAGESLLNEGNNDDEEKKEVLITPNKAIEFTATSSTEIDTKLYQYIVTEIELITTVIHQHLSRSTKREHLIDPSSSYKLQEMNSFFQNLLKQFEYTRFPLSFDDGLNRFECIYPFCLVIKQNESPSSITGISINCITSILNDCAFLSEKTLYIVDCIQLIGDTICSVVLDVERKEFDQGLLLKFMNLICCLLKHKCYIFLSETMIWNIFEKLLYIYFNVNADHHSQALFEFAEITINLLIQKVFNKRIYNCENKEKENSKERVNSKEKRGYISLKDKILKSKKNINKNEDNKYLKSAPFNIDCLVRILSALCSGNPCSYFGGELNDNDNDDELTENRLILCLNLILIALRESGEYFVRIPRILSLITDKLCYILLHFGGKTKYIMLYQLCLTTYCALLYKLRKKMKLQNEIIFEMLFIRVLKCNLPKLLKKEHNDCLFDTERVDQILSLKEEEEEKYPISNHIKLTHDISSMSLITNDGSNDSISSNDIIKNKNNIKNERVQVDQIFVSTALEHLLDLCRTQWFIKELFLNYDCDLYSSNLCNDLISLLSKHTIPGNGVLSNIEYLSLQCLINITNALNITNNKLNMNELRNIQQKKNILQKGIDIFNDNPQKGILYLYENGIFGSSYNIPRSVFTKTKKEYNEKMISLMIDTRFIDEIVDILFYCSSLNNLKIGYYLGSEYILNEMVRNRYICRRYSFIGLSLDGAMRIFFQDFRLPIETQQVDRIVESFSQKYCLDSVSWNMSPSTTYTLCFALMMLHTNQHNQSLKNHKKMKLEEFVNLVRMVKDAQHISIKLLESLYQSMTTNEIKLCHDDADNYNISKTFWDLLIERNTIYYDNNYDNNLDILNIIFNPILTCFALILDIICKEKNLNHIKFCIPINGDELVTMICKGFYNLALFIHNTNTNNTNEMDILIQRLCQLSGLCETGNMSCGLKYSKSYCSKEISHLLFNILYCFAGNGLSENGWNYILSVIMQCARSGLLPINMYQLDDFVGGELMGRRANRSFKYLYKIDNNNNKEELEEEQTLFGTISSFIQYFNVNSLEIKNDSNCERNKLLRSAQIILTDFCKIHFVIKKSCNFNIESLRCLIKSLISNSNFGIIDNSYTVITYNNDCAVYIDGNCNSPILQISCLSVQFLSSILLHNWRRIDFIWDSIRSHFELLLDLDNNIYNALGGSDDLHSAMIESAVIGILKICVRSLQLPCNTSTQCIMSLFSLLSALSFDYKSVSFQITAAIHRFIKQMWRKKNNIQYSNYKWWTVTPWNDIFILIKSASSQVYCYDISVKIFLGILGVFDDNDENEPFINPKNNIIKQKLILKINNADLMKNICQLFTIFIESKNEILKIMMIRAICNVLSEMECFYESINNNKKEFEPGSNTKKDIFNEYILVFLRFIIKLCGSSSSLVGTKALLLLEYILFKSCIYRVFICDDISIIRQIILNILCNLIFKLNKEINNNQRIFAISLLNKYFLLNLNQLNKEKDFNEIWMKILCCSDIIKENHKLYQFCKENIKNVLKIMIQKNILNQKKNDKTWLKINDMFPTIKHELNQIKTNQYPTPKGEQIITID